MDALQGAWKKDYQTSISEFPHVSKSLVVYNLPKSVTEKELKQLCVDAVTSRATKQIPVIGQVG